MSQSEQALPLFTTFVLSLTLLQISEKLGDSDLDKRIRKNQDLMSEILGSNVADGWVEFYERVMNETSHKKGRFPPEVMQTIADSLFGSRPQRNVSWPNAAFATNPREAASRLVQHSTTFRELTQNVILNKNYQNKPTEGFEGELQAALREEIAVQGNAYALEDFRFVKVLGSGSFGVVIQAVCKANSEFSVAIKFEVFRDDLSFVENIVRPTLCLSTSTLDRSVVVPLYDIFKVPLDEGITKATGVCCCTASVMELCGPTLAQEIDRIRLDAGCIPAAFMVDFLIEMSRIVKALQDENVFIGDIKDENLAFLLGRPGREDGQFTLIDRGTARPLALKSGASRRAIVGGVVGTKGFTDPIAKAGKYDPSSDLYSVGAILFKASTDSPLSLESIQTSSMLTHLFLSDDLRSFSGGRHWSGARSKRSRSWGPDTVLG
jgi:hypothetical protein